MEEKEYTKQLFEILKITTKKLADLQNNLSMEEIVEYKANMDMFWIAILESSVGKEALLYYMIDLLNSQSKIEYKEKNLYKNQIDRLQKIKNMEKE